MKALGIDITVRMYNVGFGDAFLLLIPAKDRLYKVLVDCGEHGIFPGPRSIHEVVADVIEDVRDPDGVSRIDVVVATHRHQDHVEGFDDDAWDAVEVGEVWMPWTEHPTDAQARRIRETQSNVANKLRLAMAARSADPALLGLAEIALTNADAMETLHSGFANDAQRRFLPGRGNNQPLRLGALKGAAVHVLGPTRDAETIRDMDPPEGESYLRLADGTNGGAAGWKPFRPRWRIARQRFLSEKYFRHLYRARGFAGLLDDVKQMGEIDEFALLVQLDKAVNGTSLMLMFEIGSAFLLFPGDAQWGTWLAAMTDPASRRLLEKTTFYKVGHHGSHNATPVDFLDEVLTGRPPLPLSSMVSTRTTKKWKDIPRKPLMEELEVRTKGRLVRSDRRRSPPPKGFAFKGRRYVDAIVPA